MGRPSPIPAVPVEALSDLATWRPGENARSCTNPICPVPAKCVDRSGSRQNLSAMEDAPRDEVLLARLHRNPLLRIPGQAEQHSGASRTGFRGEAEQHSVASRTGFRAEAEHFLADPGMLFGLPRNVFH